MIHNLGGDDRGQAWTFDAILMLALMVGGVIYAMQLLPAHETRTIADDFQEAQLQQDASDLLAIAAETGALRNATLYWDDSTGQWVDANADGLYTRVPPGHPLHDGLTAVFDRNAIAYNIDVTYQTTSDESSTLRMVYQGTPGARGVSVSSTVVLHDSDNLINQGSSGTIGDSDGFYAPDIFPESEKYNVIKVRIVAWTG
jgi:hypothetical protein